MNTKSTVSFDAPFHRQMPSRGDSGIVRHWIEVAVSDLAEELPLDANPRDPNPDSTMSKRIRASLVDPESVGHSEGAFGLRHSGLTILADSIRVKDDVATIYFAPGDGLVDGGHSHALIRQAIADGEDLSGEYVMLEVITGVPAEMTPEIAGGRNTSLQVKRVSLANLADTFKGLKAALSEPDEVIWHEGDSGSFKAEHLIAVASAFDPVEYSGERQPSDVYLKVTDKLELLSKEPDRIERLSPVLDDVVQLHHVITAEAADYWEGADESASYGKPSGLPWLAHPAKPKTIPLYDDTTLVPHPMKYAAALVLTAAFRYFVEEDPDGQMFGEYRGVRWRDGDEDIAFTAWDKYGSKLLRTFNSQFSATGRDLNSCVRSPAVWAAVYNQLVVADVTAG
ncbi:MAG: AIPR family protein [Acidobacteriota bacterium]